MGAAAILCIGGRLLMHPLGQIAGGPAMFIPPVIRIAPDAPHEDVGRGVRAALAGAQHDVPSPTDARTRERLAPLLQAAGVRSWSALQVRARLVNVEMRASEIVLTPTHNGGSAGAGRGYHGAAGSAFGLPVDVHDRELGLAVMRALDQCSGTAAP